MKLENVKLPTIQPFTSSYLNHDKKVHSFFHSGFDDQEAFNKRKQVLEQRSFQRMELAECIENYMSDLPASEAVTESLSKLRTNGLVVIGGQQAGLLTGPLYSIHKVISIIQLAKKQEEKLNVPVVPVFWIAGEDHDFLEINHVFVENDGQLTKKGYPERVMDKRMASLTEFDRSSMKKWVRSVLREFGESNHTNYLLGKLDEAIDKTSTITKLFAHIVMGLFKDEGLLVIDAADPGLRKLESPFFKKLLHQSQELTDEVLDQQMKIKDEGYSPMIEMASDAVNLFITKENERILLFKTADGFSDKNGEYTFTKEELLQLIDESPERFSNNVVTRPLMQEWLFPSLAFIAGPGEIAYWAELKTAFEKADMRMPPIVPRLTISIIERDIQQKIVELDLSLQDILENGVSRAKDIYWESVKDETLDQYIRETENWLNEQYEKITSKADELHPSLSEIVAKNLSIHKRQLLFLKKKTDDTIAFKHRVTLQKYDRVEVSLRPQGGPQERVWNVFYFLNRYGYDFIHELSKLDYEFDESHKVVYL